MMRLSFTRSFLVMLAMLGATGAQSAAAQGYSDSFEGSTINPFWATQMQFGSVALSTDQSHSGSQSVKFSSASGGQREMHLTHVFPSPTKGQFAIYFYDAAPGQETLYEKLILYNSAQPNLSAGIGTQDFDAYCYSANLSDAAGLVYGPNGTCGIYPQVSTTNVPRTLGWHRLEVNVATNITSFAIDAQQVFTINGDYNFDTVEVRVSGPVWRPNTTAYFDDFNFTVVANERTISFTNPTSYSVGRSPSGITTADFNHDSVRDLVVVNSADNTFSYLQGNGDGTFRPPVNFSMAGAAGALPGPITAADFNRDGNLDLAIAHPSSTGSGFGNTVTIHLGDGAGRFTTPGTVFTTGGSDTDITNGDFNEDGKVDLAIGACDQQSVYVHSGNGDGTFSLATQSFVGGCGGGSLLSVTASDLNRDGHLDLIASGISNNTVSVLLGNGAGVFGQPKVSSVDRGPTTAATGDFNHDGNLDLAVADVTDGVVTTLSGDGAGNFVRTGSLNVGRSPLDVLAADFNQDGHLDLLVTNTQSIGVSVLPGVGDGQFSPQLVFAAGSGPTHVAVADYNRGGLLDVAVTNNQTGTVSVLLGNSASNCTYSISPTQQSFSSGGGSNSVAVTSPSGCNWTAISNANWITITTGASGSGNGTVSYTVAANTSTSSRTGTLTIAGQTFTVTQSAAPCTFLLSPTAQSFASAAGTGSVSVTASAGCSWTATSNSSFITITAGSSGTGSGTVSYAVAANTTTSQRTGTLIVAGQTFTVTQAGASPTYSIAGRVTDANGASLSDVTMTLSSASPQSTQTDVNGNYSFANLTGGLAYTLTPAKINYAFTPVSRSFPNLSANQTANFTGTPTTYTISGRVTATSASGPGVGGVTVTVSGTNTAVTQTDESGNYAVAVAAGGTYSVTPSGPFYVFTPPRTDFVNLSASQTANFITLPTATPTPTPPLSEDFTGTQRDTTKFNLGTLTQPASSFDPQIPVVQQGGRLIITPRVGVTDPHFNGYVSVNSFDFTGATATVELVQAATGGAVTTFAVGSDPDNNFRFVVGMSNNPAFATFAPRALAALGIMDVMPVLVFQVKINGVVTQQVIPYDPGQHRFFRFSRDAAINAILFETSPDGVAYTERFRKTLDKSVSVLAVELSAGTATPTSGSGSAIFDNLSLVTSTVQFSMTNNPTTNTLRVSEGAGHATITITRAGNVSSLATLAYTTMDNPAAVRCDDTTALPGVAFARCDYATAIDTLTFAADEVSKTFTVPIINDSFAEGDETFTLVLRDATGASVGAPGLITVTIQDDDAPGQPNPIFSTPFFVRQHYLDFLARDPEAGEPWSRILNTCSDVNNNPACDRILVSQSFFGSPEFLTKGVYVIVFYRAAFGRLPEYAEFAPDLRAVTGATPPETLAKRAAFANAFVQRMEFLNQYGALSNPAYVTTLLGRYNLTSITTPDPADPDGPTRVTLTKTDLIDRLSASALTRAQVLRAIVQSDEVSLNREAINAFVASQYYGFLRRTPDTGGFNGWVNYLAAHPGDFRTMVNGFMNSTEYRLRFGNPNQ